MPERAATPAMIDYLRSLSTFRAIFGTDVSPADTQARINDFLADNPTFDETGALLDQAKRAPRYPSDALPATPGQHRQMQQRAANQAIFGLVFTPEETVLKVDEMFAAPGFTMADASNIIRSTYGAPPHPTAQSGLPLHLIEGIDGLNLTEGHYAVSYEGVIRFYRIFSPSTGTNRGIPVIRRFAGDNLMALYPNEARPVLHSIDADPDAAAYRFSDTYTRCWKCGRNLTDAVSRLLSIGPNCRGFGNHSGLRAAANDVDHNTERRFVYRALRAWALDKEFSVNGKDPKTTATLIASAWSGIPGILHMPSHEATAAVQQAFAGEVSPQVQQSLLDAPADTVLVLIDAGVLSPAVVTILNTHSAKRVRDAASEFFLSLLGS